VKKIREVCSLLDFFFEVCVLWHGFVSCLFLYLTHSQMVIASHATNSNEPVAVIAMVQQPDPPPLS
jgi:hypothetical protein